MQTIDSVHEMLAERAARYGGTLSDILDKTPTILWDSPTELEIFWSEHDLSHVFPQSTHPWLADDWSNIVAENSGTNRARGADIMTHGELVDAEYDVMQRASEIDATVFDDSPEFAGELIDVIYF